MTNLPLLGEGFCVRRLLCALTLFSCSAFGQGANQITGSVLNQSRREPAAGDEVILLRQEQGFEEEARAKTDAQGMFTLAVEYPNKPYLVRVFHQGVSYDQQASAGDAFSIQVFDAALRVGNITGSIEILRAATTGKLLHVSDLYEVRNDSNPPVTEVGKRTFEAYLPAHALMDSVFAAGPENLGTIISATPVPDEPGHWTVNFPLRPGATKFAFNYDLPYDGHAAFHVRHRYRLEQLAIMIPPTMQFLSRSPAFEILAVDRSRYQVRAANHLAAGDGPAFEVSGTGDLPPLGNQAKSETPSPQPLLPRSTAPAQSLLAEPAFNWIDSTAQPRPPPSQSFALGAVTFLLLAMCIALVWRARRRSCSAQPPCATEPSEPSPPADLRNRT